MHAHLGGNVLEGLLEDGVQALVLLLRLVHLHVGKVGRLLHLAQARSGQIGSESRARDEAGSSRSAVIVSSPHRQVLVLEVRLAALPASRRASELRSI